MLQQATMTRLLLLQVLLLVAVPSILVSAFTTNTLATPNMYPTTVTKQQSQQFVLHSSSAPDSDGGQDQSQQKQQQQQQQQQQQEDGLVLDGLDTEMGKMASKFSFTETDFLAAAKKRAAERVESKNASAADKEWEALAEEKKTEYGEIDDWDNSMKEAGNKDSQILMFTDPPAAADGEDKGEDDEPKLLLF
jgi:hypothetical protein